jgi:hypothetical protein
MNNAEQRNFEYRFKPVSPEPLSRCVIGAKVPIDVEKAIRSLPSEERSKWIRRVLTEAARRELTENTA